MPDFFQRDLNGVMRKLVENTDPASGQKFYTDQAGTVQVQSATPTANVGTATTVTINGTVAAGARSVTFRPATGVTATVQGWPLTAGVETVIDEPGCTLSALSYTVSGGAMKILEVR